jgi:hypothetical protein
MILENEANYFYNLSFALFNYKPTVLIKEKLSIRVEYFVNQASISWITGSVCCEFGCRAV